MSRERPVHERPPHDHGGGGSVEPPTTFRETGHKNINLQSAFHEGAEDTVVFDASNFKAHGGNRVGTINGFVTEADGKPSDHMDFTKFLGSEITFDGAGSSLSLSDGHVGILNADQLVPGDNVSLAANANAVVLLHGSNGDAVYELHADSTGEVSVALMGVLTNTDLSVFSADNLVGAAG